MSRERGGERETDMVELCEVETAGIEDGGEEDDGEADDKGEDGRVVHDERG
jgi:hypothetical protein